MCKYRDPPSHFITNYKKVFSLLSAVVSVRGSRRFVLQDLHMQVLSRRLRILFPHPGLLLFFPVFQVVICLQTGICLPCGCILRTFRFLPWAFFQVRSRYCPDISAFLRDRFLPLTRTADMQSVLHGHFGRRIGFPAGINGTFHQQGVWSFHCQMLNPQIGRAHV